MSPATSPSTGRIYGVARVLRAWELARSSFYYQRTVVRPACRVGERRGPKTAWTDAALTGCGSRGCARRSRAYSG